MDNLKPCPFCAAALALHGGFWCHPANECIISQTEFVDEPEFEAAWNARKDTPSHG